MEAIAIPKGFRITPEQFEQLACAEEDYLPGFTLDLTEILTSTSN